MTLATIDTDGYPDARTVLLSEVDRDGLYFYTDSRSRKARQLAEADRARAVLVWPDDGRQLSVQGDVEPVPAGHANAAFDLYRGDDAGPSHRTECRRDGEIWLVSELPG